MSDDAKTFHDLMLEVQRFAFCGKCGGCVSFCSAGNLGALEVGLTNAPVCG
jgi:coenzyme F420 hydrogenase subunit beta